MKWNTHAVVGANAVWLTVLVGRVDSTALLLMAVGALAGLLPDIDAGGSGAKIHHMGKGSLKMFRGVFEHRGFFHSVLVVFLLLLISLFIFFSFDPLLPLIITTGYASHLLIDGFNFKGTRYLFPMRKKFHLVPKLFASPVGGIADTLFFLFGTIGMLAFLLMNLDVFTTGISLSSFF